MVAGGRGGPQPLHRGCGFPGPFRVLGCTCESEFRRRAAGALVAGAAEHGGPVCGRAAASEGPLIERLFATYPTRNTSDDPNAC